MPECGYLQSVATANPIPRVLPETRLRFELMRRSPVCSASLFLLFCVSCAKPQAEYRPTTTIKDLMDGIVDPAADTIWGSVATINGKEEKTPHTDEEWLAVRRSALQLVEASNLLQIPGRHVAKPGERNRERFETGSCTCAATRRLRISPVCLTRSSGVGFNTTGDFTARGFIPSGGTSTACSPGGRRGNTRS